MIIELIVGAAIISGFLMYKWLTLNFDHFEKLGIPYVKPTVIVGSFAGFIFGRESMRDEFLRTYNDFKHLKAYGIFEGRNPALVINDLDLLKKITIKDFEYFKNRRVLIDPEDDPIFGNGLIGLGDKKWHDMRITLSPAYSGTKMRLMFQLILDISEKAAKHLEKNIKNKPNSKDGIEFEMKKFFMLFATDVIASTSFGLEVNSLENKNNEFYKMGQGFVTFSKVDVFRFFLYTTFRKVCKIVGFKPLNQKFYNYFYGLVVDAMKYRKKHNIVRQDMINILIEAQSNSEKSHNRKWTNTELVAQCGIFLFAGLESTSTTLSFATQELIENPKSQEKLSEEIDAVNQQLNGEPLTYEILTNMKYMDQVMSEVLRKWPPFILTDRVCTKPYKIEENGLKINFNIGDMIWIPIVGLHLNDNHFPDPLKFDPERFSYENKSNINSTSYAPFGCGPRLCIASRLSLLECKAILFYILTHFQLDVCKKTKIPVELETLTFLVTAKDGFWLKLIPRNLK